MRTYAYPNGLGVTPHVQVEEEGAHGADDARVEEEYVHGPDDAYRAAKEIEAELVVGLVPEVVVIRVQVIHLVSSALSLSISLAHTHSLPLRFFFVLVARV